VAIRVGRKLLDTNYFPPPTVLSNQKSDRATLDDVASNVRDLNHNAGTKSYSVVGTRRRVVRVDRARVVASKARRLCLVDGAEAAGVVPGYHRANLRSQRGRVARASSRETHETKESSGVTLTQPTFTAGGAAPRLRRSWSACRETPSTFVMSVALRNVWGESILLQKKKPGNNRTLRPKGNGSFRAGSQCRVIFELVDHINLSACKVSPPQLSGVFSRFSRAPFAPFLLSSG
jgi:hypothetical protein